jgi:hypothetical protein
MTYKDSHEYSKFDGHWVGGMFLEGTLIYKNGDSFFGSFRDGKIHNGTQTYANGGDPLESKETRP